MGGSVFTPKQRNWRWYADAAGPTSPLANENVKPTLANNTDIVRARISIAETGGKANNNAVTVLEYSINQTDWFTLGSAAHWNHANGADTDQTLVSSLLLTDSGAQGEYCESATSNVSYGASVVTENDMSVVPTGNVSASTTYYFRTMIGGTAVPLDTAETYPQVLTAAAGVDVTVQVGLVTGTGTVQSTTQSGDANVPVSLVQGNGVALAVTNVTDQVLSMNLVTGSGQVFPVTVSIGGGDVTVLLNLQTGAAQVFSATPSGDANVPVGMLTGAGQVQGPSILTDAVVATAVLEGTATIFSVVVDVGGQKRSKVFIITMPNLITVPDIMIPPN